MRALHQYFLFDSTLQANLPCNDLILMALGSWLRYLQPKPNLLVLHGYLSMQNQWIAYQNHNCAEQYKLAYDCRILSVKQSHAQYYIHFPLALPIQRSPHQNLLQKKVVLITIAYLLVSLNRFQKTVPVYLVPLEKEYELHPQYK